MVSGRTKRKLHSTNSEKISREGTDRICGTKRSDKYDKVPEERRSTIDYDFCECILYTVSLATFPLGLFCFAPSTWNSLSVHIRSVEKLSTFKLQLKSHLFWYALIMAFADDSHPLSFSRILALYKFKCVYIYEKKIDWLIDWLIDRSINGWLIGRSIDQW